MTQVIDRSYQLGTFRDNEDSLRRLKRQAEIALDLEFQQLAAAGLQSGQRVLDVGCGPGLISLQIARRNAPSRLVAADCNEISVAEASRQLRDAGVPAEVKMTNLYDPAVSELGSFDFVYARFVLQHLSEPQLALVNLRGCLAEGGRLCLCDVDDRWLSVEPSPPELATFLGRVGRAQASRGGDRQVGSKLAHYLQRSGFEDIRCTGLLLSTDMIGKEAFCDLVFGYKLEVIPANELTEARRELECIKEAVHSPYGWAGVVALFVSGSVASQVN